MKKYILRFRILLLTLALGLATSSFYQNISQKAEDEELKNAIILTGAPKPPRFTETFRACGLGYVQGYISNDNIKLTEGSMDCHKPEEKNIVQKDNLRVISRIEKNTEMRYQIYQIENQRCIDAPNLEIALEFEKWHKFQN